MRRLAAHAATLVLLGVAPPAGANPRFEHAVPAAAENAPGPPEVDVGDESSTTPEEERRKIAARHMAHRAMDLMREGRWADAQALLQHAYQLVPAPTLAVLEGDALVQLGELNQAARRFDAARRAELRAGAPPAYHRAVRIAKSRLLALNARIPRLVIAIKGVDGEEPLGLWLNDEPLSPALLGVERHVDPGQYTVRAEVNGKTVSRQIELKEGSAEHVVLDPDNDAATVARDDSADRERQRRRTAGWISVGVGGAGVLTGVVAGIITQNKERDLKARCTPTCPPSLQGEVEAFERARTTSWVGYGVGALGLGTGIALLLTSRGEPATSARIQPYATLRGVGVRGSF
jgi:hypothetical protein